MKVSESAFRLVIRSVIRRTIPKMMKKTLDQGILLKSLFKIYQKLLQLKNEKTYDDCPWRSIKKWFVHLKIQPQLHRLRILNPSHHQLHRLRQFHRKAGKRTYTMKHLFGILASWYCDQNWESHSRLITQNICRQGSQQFLRARLGGTSSPSQR